MCWTQLLFIWYRLFLDELGVDITNGLLPWWLDMFISTLTDNVDNSMSVYLMKYMENRCNHNIWIKTYRQVSNIRRTLVGNKIVDHLDVVGASPVGAAPTTSSFST